MKRFTIFFCVPIITILALTGALFTTTPTIFTIGDSTMALYDTMNTENQRGWAQMLATLSVTNIVDAARGGRSSKSFINEGLWAAVAAQIQDSDYVFVQFAHNDEKDSILYPDIHTDPWTTYYAYLQQYVNDTRDTGGIPILFTPIVRRYFSNDTITAKGMHNTGTGDSVGNYPAAMRAVAEAMNVPLVDLTLKTKALVEGYGSDKSTLLYISSDDTHPDKFGAILIARLAIHGLREKNLAVASYFDTTAVIYGSQDTVACGEQYVGANSASNLYIISAFNLLPYSDSITVTAPLGFQISISSSGGFAQTLKIAYSRSTIIAQRIYIRFSPVEAENYSDTISIAGGGSAGKTFWVTGSGKAVLPGTRSSVTWNLTGSSSVSSVVGFFTGSAEAYSSLITNNYAIVGSDTCKSQRNLPPELAWTAEGAQNNSRYLQFAVIAGGATVTIDTIRMYIGAAGGSGMRANICYSTDSTFTASTQLNSSVLSFTSNTITSQVYALTKVLDNEQSLYVRIYPWYTSSATGKYICLHHVTISGTAAATGVGNASILSVPETFGLSQNYPNPFNPSTLVQYQLPINSHVVLTIYNMLGKAVREIVNTIQAAGFHTVQINMSDAASGVYFYKIQAGTFTQTQKMLLIK